MSFWEREREKEHVVFFPRETMCCVFCGSSFEKSAFMSYKHRHNTDNLCILGAIIGKLPIEGNVSGSKPELQLRVVKGQEHVAIENGTKQLKLLRPIDRDQVLFNHSLIKSICQYCHSRSSHLTLCTSILFFFFFISSSLLAGHLLTIGPDSPLSGSLVKQKLSLLHSFSQIELFLQMNSNLTHKRTEPRTNCESKPAGIY